MAAFLDCSCKSSTILKCEGRILSLCRGGSHPQRKIKFHPRLKNGGGVECCLEGCRTSGLVSWSGDPPDCTLFKGTKLSWELAEGHQGPTQNRSHSRTDAGYLPGVQGRPLRKERHPSSDHWKDLMWLSQLFCFPLETNVGLSSSQGDIPTWGRDRG